MKTGFRFMLAGIGLAVMSVPAEAAMVGSNPEYPVGNTLGQPTGLLPPPGVYLTFKPSYTQSRPVDGNGHFTGAHANIWGATGSLAYIPDIRIFGARYGMFIRSLGWLNVSLTTPRAAGGKTFNRIGLVDTEFTPLSLSWDLGHHVFFDADFGFYPPNGQYSDTAKVNTGQNHWTIEPDMSVSWLPGPYQFTVHATLDKNFENSATHYTNGSTMDWDFTAMRGFGHWSIGPVSYFYKQITADSGPAALNGGSPEAFALGADVAYQGKGYKMNMFFTHDVYARNVGEAGKVVLTLSVPLM